MKSYWSISAGSPDALRYALEDEVFGVGYNFKEDLDAYSSEWSDFKGPAKEKLRAEFPDKKPVGIGLLAGQLWSLSKVMKEGDIVLLSDSREYGQHGIVYRLGVIESSYEYKSDDRFFIHQRKINWTGETLHRRALSKELQNSLGAALPITKIAKDGVEEIKARLSGSLDFQEEALEGVEDEVAFEMELHLEDFLVRNWQSTPLAQKWDIYEEDGELLGKQYPTDTGPLDILAISKDKQSYLVIELKRGRANDKVVGQILRYMGYIQEEIAESEQTVQGLIIALEEDTSLQRTLRMTNDIEFMRYRVSFELL